MPHLSVLYTNIRSLMRNRDDLCSLIDSCSADIIFLTETWLSAKVPSYELFARHKQYTVYRGDRLNRTGGGVLIALSDALIASPVHISSNLEALWLKAECSYNSLILGVCYRSPSLCGTFVNDLHDSLNLIFTRFPKTPVFLLGDFNYPAIAWSETCPYLKVYSSEAADFLELCRDFNMTQLVTSPTRVVGNSSSILDLLLTSDPSKVSDIVHLPALSDHDVLHFFIRFPQLHRFSLMALWSCQSMRIGGGIET